MDPPPRPSMDRFRIRVAVFSPEEAHNLEAVPKHTFVIARSQHFPLQDLPLRELRDVAIRRYKDIYPQESLFQIAQSTDAYGADLYLNDRVGDIFADNEVLRVIKGSSIRDSLPPDYVNGRAGSVQPSYPLQRKRSPATSNLGDNSRAGKRQKVYRPDDPVPSRERDPSDSEEENVLPEDILIDEVIPDSQVNEVEDVARHIKQEKPSQASRPSYNPPSPVLGYRDDGGVVISDSQGKETSGRNTTRQTRQSLRNTTEAREDLQIAAKATPKPSNGAARRPSNKRRERSDDISDFEEHTSITPTITPSRGISDTYSDFETDIEQPSSFLRRRGRVTPLRKNKKASPISAKPKVIQYGKKAATKSKASGSDNSTPKAITPSTPAITPRSASMANSGPILPGMTRQPDSASTDNVDDKSEEGVDAGAEEAAQEVSRLTSESAGKKRAAELEQESRRTGQSEGRPEKAMDQARIEREAVEKKSTATAIATAKIKAAKRRRVDAARKRLAEEERLKEEAEKEEEEEEAEKEAEKEAEREAEMEARATEAKLKRDHLLAEEARRQTEANEKAEAEEREQAKRREAEAAAKAEAVKRKEAAKGEKEASDKKDAEVASARKRSTSAISPGGMLGRAVANFNSETASTSPSANVVDMPPPPAAARGRLSMSPALTRKRSEDIRSTPILPPRRSSDIRPASSVELGPAARRVSFAEPSPSVAGKTPSRATQSPAPVQTPKTVNGIPSFRQSKLVPPGTGAKSVTPKAPTPSSSQAPPSGQQVKSTPTPTPKTRADITAALLNTINKGSSSAVKAAAAAKPNAIAISSDEESSDDESVGELELPPLPPPSSHSIAQSQIAASGDNANDTASNTSRSASVSTNRSQRESRSPVRFVNSSFHSNAASSTQSFDGSRRAQQGHSNGSETSDKSTSGESASEDEASESELSPTRSKPTIPSSQSAASQRILPPSSRLSQLRDGSTTPKPQNVGARKVSSGSDAETSVQKLLDSQLTEESVASSAPARGQASPAPSSSQFSARNSSTPVPRPKLTNGNTSDRGTPRTSERPAGMASMPSLKLRTEAALEESHRRAEKARQEGEAKAKALKDAEVADAEITEESEAESSSDSDSNSDDGDESNSEAGSNDDVEMGGMGTPKAQKPKAKVNFSGLSKKFSKGLAGRR
ncbi:hypothetical protein V499_03758 [Pseudogymnoascus sp. VKM F-103]|uniref:Nucleolar protein Dnt1-like N-terminal domain-containing protein n=1 Tax=Pseudogymnoascus verrucosus TaxID=342668 RepID=A0A1B8GWJ0_9PEZI|nr:uncharacterized protein VE01_01704 [Pseudogymnoascus verrucosus]KFY76662.1 hypothetical protein V499_03758 [Pseudogymnoascus sp. VKM F-103]OBU00161.1 hypothetical protein VE01_01704 [Pseudogymnoascus verrucosus]